MFRHVLRRARSPLSWSETYNTWGRSFSSALRTSIGAAAHGDTGGFELTFLGTSSQGGACRYPSSLALRLCTPKGSQVWVFDAGEGCTAQLQRSYMRVGLVQNIFITHVHGDHLYGLPGLVLSALSRRQQDPASAAGLKPLTIYGPQGLRNFLRMALGVASSAMPIRDALVINELIFPNEFGLSTSQRFRFKKSLPYWRAAIRPLHFECPGRDIAAEECPNNPGQFTYKVLGHTEADAKNEQAGAPDTRTSTSTPCFNRDRYNGDGTPATVIAAPVAHTVPCLAYKVTENVISRRFDKDKLSAFGIPASGDSSMRDVFQAWLRGENVTWHGKCISPDSVMIDGRSARTLCVIGDTHDASGAAHIAKDVDVLVHEATNLAAQTHIARRRGHSSTRGATAFAKRVNAKRLLLNHTSVAYSEPKLRVLETEARTLFGVDRVYVARDLSVFSIPTEEEDDDNFIFRKYVGFTAAADSMRLRGMVVDSHGELVRLGRDLLGSKEMRRPMEEGSAAEYDDDANAELDPTFEDIEKMEAEDEQRENCASQMEKENIEVDEMETVPATAAAQNAAQ